MRGGQLRHRLTILKPVGASGDEVVDSGVPAAIEFVTPGSPESLRFGVPVTAAAFRIRVRYRTDVRADWRVVDELGRTFQISGYGDPEDKRRELHLLCSEIQ